MNAGGPVPVRNSELSTTGGCSSFSNAKGELLFYVGAPTPNARNLTIWNRDNVPMPFSDVTSGGQTLKGDSSSSQSALTVPAPTKDDIYYLFTVGATIGAAGEHGFWYYTVDMTKDGGFGDIVNGPIELHTPTLKDQWSEKVTAVRADACNTFWVISFATGNTFFAYKVDNIYAPESDSGIRYDDKELNIDWGVEDSEVIVSEKDAELPFFLEFESPFTN